jgi:uncharacterized protein (TIGR02147 family)
MVLTMHVATILKNELKKRQTKNSRFSLRSFAKLLTTDASFLSKVMAGKKRPSEATFKRWALKLSISDEIQRAVLQRLNESRGVPREVLSPFKNLTMEVFENHYQWYYPLLLEFFTLPNAVPNLASAARQLGIAQADVKAALSDMLGLGLLKPQKKGSAQYVLSHLSTEHSLNLTSDRLRAMQRKYLELGSKAIENVPVSRRENTTVTLSLDEAELAEVRQILQKAREKLGHIFGRKNKARTKVYNISMALYPVLEQEE